MRAGRTWIRATAPNHEFAPKPAPDDVRSTLSCEHSVWARRFLRPLAHILHAAARLSRGDL